MANIDQDKERAISSVAHTNASLEARVATLEKAIASMPAEIATAIRTADRYRALNAYTRGAE